MPTFNTFLSLLKTPKKLFRSLAARGLFNWMPDELYLKILFQCELNQKLNLKNPKTFNEKIQWLKLNDHNPEYPLWVDKESAKKMAEERLGKEHIVDTIAIWSKAEDLDFSQLPDKCVLKCTHDQGSTIVFDRSKKQNLDEIRNFYKKCLKKNAYTTTREWPYKNLQGRIICEPFLADNIVDYKVFCCNVKVVFVNIGQKDHNTHTTYVTFIDLDWKPLPFQRSDNPPIEKLPKKPDQLNKMVEMAQQLARGKKFVRIDFYLVDGKIYFSEFTLYPTSGLIQFDPREGDEVLGNRLQITD